VISDQEKLDKFLEQDFDPENYESLMKEEFDDDYYEGEDPDQNEIESNSKIYS
jgi:hypothetical protein